ncbi:hypothetical protein C3486_28655 [Streptomyces sp. Ru73]|uniref:DUF6571 family protein n=1 Tax=Streptomyces sp. Ru73 TaxID=2080748 RepID=UPI000CDD0FE3|nr:DUF6571 family protein [Streptomyces sp. Ru73]POX37385.1 hypothetical protein C3486_28655 [Streptomyces sp. Ru73]
MLSYHDALHTDLSTLTDAAEKWDKTAEMFKDAAKIYDQKVKGIFEDGSASGQHAQAGLLATGTTSGQYTGAQKEAKAIADILRDAHHQFVELRKKLKSEIADAKHAKMLISSDKGVCSWDWDNMDSETKRAVTHDGSASEVPEYWTKRIAKAVKDMDDADQGVKLALDAVTVDSAPLDGIKNGFNAKAEGDIEKVEGKRADELSTKLNSEGKLPPQEMAELERLFRDNSDDKAFSRTYLNGLGAENTIKLGNTLREMGKDGNRVEKGLADSIATATKVPASVAKMPVDSKAYKEWLDSADGRFNKKFLGDLKEVGTKNFASNTEPVYGYQDFVTLLKHGSGYDDQFMHHLANDIIETEKKQPDLWDIWNGKPVQKGIEHDPLDGVLGIMSKDPAASTAYLDPQHNDHLKYLLKDRDWPKYVMNGPGMVSDNDTMSELYNRHGFGAALESAATGNVPGTEHAYGGHTEAEARVMRDTIKLLNGDDQSGAKMPANLRAPLGHMLTDYTPDTHEILSRTNGTYKQFGDEGGVFRNEDSGAVGMAVSRNDLVNVMRGVAEDPAAYGDMYAAERQYAADTLAGVPIVPKNPAEESQRDGVIHAASSAFGFYDGVTSDVLYDKRDAKIQWARDLNHHVTSTSGTALNFIPSSPKAVPVLGDAANRILDFGMYDWTKETIAEAGAQAGKEDRANFEAGQKEVDNLVYQWGKKQGYDSDDWEVRNLDGKGLDTHNTARSEAFKWLDRPES